MTDTPAGPPPVLPTNAPTVAGSPWLTDQPTTPAEPEDAAEATPRAG